MYYCGTNYLRATLLSIHVHIETNPLNLSEQHQITGRQLQRPGHKGRARESVALSGQRGGLGADSRSRNAAARQKNISARPCTRSAGMRAHPASAGAEGV